MPNFTLIARSSDGLHLAASMEDERDHRKLDQQKAEAKRIVKALSPSGPTRMTIESGGSSFNYINQDGVCFLCLIDKSYPRRLAFNFLEELQREFMRLHRDEVDKASRPYAFIKFDTFIQKTKRLYVDTRTTRNLSKMNEDLQDMTKIMTQNIQDVLGRGERLETVVNKASRLRDDSSKYAKNAKHLNRLALLRKYGPLAFVLLLVLGGLWWRFR